jgi:AP-4 complex subunit epsilon-1
MHTQDPGVMSAALCALHGVIKANPAPYKNLVPSFTSILKQVREFLLGHPTFFQVFHGLHVS